MDGLVLYRFVSGVRLIELVAGRPAEAWGNETRGPHCRTSECEMDETRELASPMPGEHAGGRRQGPAGALVLRGMVVNLAVTYSRPSR